MVQLPRPALPTGMAADRVTTDRINLLIASYVATVMVAFIYWRKFEPVVVQQALLIAIFSFATLAVVRSVERASGARAVVTVPIAILGMMLYPILSQRAGQWAFVPLVGFAIWEVLSIVASVRLSSTRAWCLAIGLIGAGLALIEFFLVNGGNYSFILSDVGLALGVLHKDTLFHSAIIRMLDEHDVVSTGLHGLTPLTYYVGVHRLIAALSRMTNADVALMLTLGMQLFLIPMVLYSFLRAVHVALGGRAFGIQSALLCLSVLLFAQKNLYYPFSSESYTMSLVFFFSAIPIGLGWLSREARLDRSLGLEVLCTGILIIAAALTKVSTAFILATFFGICLFDLIHRSRPALALAGLATASAFGLGLCLVVYTLFDPSLMPVYWGHFVIEYPARWLNFIVYLIVGVAVSALLKRFVFPNVPLTAMIAVVGIIANVPPLTFNFPGYGGIYFLHPAVLLVITVVLIGAVEAMSVADLQRFNDRRILGGAAIVVAVFAIWIAAMGYRTFQKRIQRFERDVVTVQKPTLGGGLDRRTPLQLVGDQIAGLKQDGERALIFVAPNNSSVWIDTRAGCWAQAYAIPALTGLPMLAGVRGKATGCDTTPFYGMSDYDSSAENRELTSEQRCREARTLGFNTVYSVDVETTVTRAACGSP
jgi:hypothetical protein